MKTKVWSGVKKKKGPTIKQWGKNDPLGLEVYRRKKRAKPLK